VSLLPLVVALSATASATPMSLLMDPLVHGGQGKPVVLQYDAAWSPVSYLWAEWVAGGPAISGSASWPTIPSKVANGDVYWVILMDEGRNGGQPILPAEVAAFHAQANLTDNMIVLGLPDDSILQWLSLQQYPTFVLLDENLTFQADPGFTDVLALVDALP
jgi:hypothetical protein